MATNRPRAQTKHTTQNILNYSYDEVNEVLAVEVLDFDGVSLSRTKGKNLSLQIEYDGSSNPIYLGQAAPGTPTSTALWQIRKLTFDGNNNVTSIKYANGSSNFDQIWNDRGSLSYS